MCHVSPNQTGPQEAFAILIVDAFLDVPNARYLGFFVHIHIIFRANVVISREVVWIRGYWITTVNNTVVLTPIWSLLADKLRQFVVANPGCSVRGLRFVSRQILKPFDRIPDGRHACRS